MPLVSKPYNYNNGQTIDAAQLDQNLDTLYNLINGLLDAVNIAANGLNDPNKFAAEVITQAKSKGLIYSQDLYGQSWVVSGGVTTASGSPANQITVTTLIANILQSDGSYRHVTVAGTTYVTSIINATYFLELQPDGTMNWSQTHSTQAGFMPIATVTSNASGNINVITDTRTTSLALKPPIVQNPNLLFNPSARMGLNGWNVSSGLVWSSVFDSFGGGGWFQSTNVNNSGVFQILKSQQIPITAAIPLTISGEIDSSKLTAGYCDLQIHAFNALNVEVGTTSVSANFGNSGFTKYNVTYTTPANTTYVIIQLVISATAVGYGLFKKIKVEFGSYPTTFSDDNTLNTQQYGSVLGLAQIIGGTGFKIQTGTGSTTVATAGTQVTSTIAFPTSFTGSSPIVFVVPVNTSTGSNYYINTLGYATTATNFSLSVNAGVSVIIYWAWIAIGT